MKKFIAVLIIFFILTALIIFHSFIMHSFGKDAADICRSIEDSAKQDDWNEVLKDLKKLNDLWQKRRFWAALTIRTNVIEEIDISLKQSLSYAKIKAKPDFLGEFIMLQGLMEHIPHQEGLHIEEIL